MRAAIAPGRLVDARLRLSTALANVEIANETLHIMTSQAVGLTDAERVGCLGELRLVEEKLRTVSRLMRRRAT